MGIQHSSVKIRPIKETDLSGVLEVYLQCQDFLALGPDPVASLALVQQDFESSQREGGRYCGICSSDGPVIGVVDFIPEIFEGNPQNAFISLLMISAPYRQGDIGEQIIRWIEAKIKTDSQVTTIFSTVQVNNPGALRFWQKNSYQIISGLEVQADSTGTYRLQRDI